VNIYFINSLICKTAIVIIFPLISAAQCPLDSVYDNKVIYDEPFKQIRLKAQSGDPYYQALVGSIYRRGIDVKADFKKAKCWLDLSSKYNIAISLYNLGVMYYYGNGVSKDTAYAQNLFKQCYKDLLKESMNGRPYSQFCLSNLYRYGLGISMDSIMEMQWLRASAVSGFAGAQFNLADDYIHGYHVKVDTPLGIKWYNDALQQGYKDAANNLGYTFEHEGKDSLALEYYKMGSDLGSSIAARNAAKIYLVRYFRDSSENELRLYLTFYELAAKNAGDGEETFYTEYADIFETGQWTKRDYATARKWYEKAAEGGNAYANYKIAWYYFAGISGTDKDSVKAEKYFNEAANAGNAEAKFMLDFLSERK
jgi:TPR repeat protein